MIKFKDFVPEELTKAGFFTSATLEKFNDTLNRANHWIETQNIELINIETVILPNIHQSDEEGSSDTEIRTSGEMSSYWNQFIRVWYKTKT